MSVLTDVVNFQVGKAIIKQSMQHDSILVKGEKMSTYIFTDESLETVYSSLISFFFNVVKFFACHLRGTCL